MVIYDTNNNFNNSIKGMLHISMMDVDYLVHKYQLPGLKEMIPSDYVDAFESELEERKNEGQLSEQYYAILSLGIETDEDEELLRIIKSEVEQGNLFTKSDLQSIKRKDLEDLINPLKSRESELSDEELYKLRSYLMDKYIIESIEKANRNLEAFKQFRSYTYSNSYNTIVTNLESIGLSKDIVELDYFKPSKGVPLVNKNI